MNCTFGASGSHNKSRLHVQRHFLFSSQWPRAESSFFFGLLVYPGNRQKAPTGTSSIAQPCPEVQSAVESCYFKLLNNSNAGRSLACKLPSCTLTFKFQLNFHLLTLHENKKLRKSGRGRERCHPLVIGKLEHSKTLIRKWRKTILALLPDWLHIPAMAHVEANPPPPTHTPLWFLIHVALISPKQKPLWRSDPTHMVKLLFCQWV